MALARWETAAFSSRATSARMRPPNGVAAKTGSYPKPPASSGRKGDLALQRAVGHNFATVRVGEHQSAPKTRRTVGESDHFGKQVLEALLVIEPGSTITRRIDSRTTVQRIDLQTGIIRQCPTVHMNGDRTRLELCIGQVGVAILHDDRRVLRLGNQNQLFLRQNAKLPQLARVA